MQTSLFQQSASPTLRMFILVCACLALMITDSRYDQLSGVRRVIDTAVTPLRYAVNAPFQLYNWCDEWFTSHNTLIANNRKLSTENFELRTRQQQLEIVQKENERLHALLNSSQKVTKRSIVAKLMKVALQPYSQQITLDKGLKDDVYIGQSVIGSNGIMGQIIHANDFTSTALLITDGKHDIPVQSNRSGFRTIARGTGRSNELELLHVPNNTDILVGDLMISSGFGGRFPRNYPVARVTDIQLDPSAPFATITATPTAAIDRVSEVLLIWPTPQEAPRKPSTEFNALPSNSTDSESASHTEQITNAHTQTPSSNQTTEASNE